MRPLEETLSRWRATVDCGASITDLRRAVREDGPSSPCLVGCRSVCWKRFLLPARPDMAQALRDGRKDYSQLRSRFLNFIEHPEALAQLAVDPLTDDPESPWNATRQDETIRAEIRQDVQRLPDEANYHQDQVQAMIIDILFVYCKVNPDRGGYRQGMHELLAPIVHVVEQDAVDRAMAGADAPSLDESMLELLDSSYVEHDAYILFSRLMESAQVFYEPSTIVEKSKFIHEVCLRKVDEELANHLVEIEVLPQIFLIRWIRLLFSREFPFNQVLVLWDTIFAVDPSLDLMDFICCAMLVRIRWQLLEADYPVCLKLLLKYPPPAPPHGPHTFVDDAIYLKAHGDASGGIALVRKYTGRTPESLSPSQTAQSTQTGTPGPPWSGSPRPRAFGGRSPLPSPSRFLQQQGGVESLFQGAAKSAKGVLERGEKLGLNHAVREAVGEIRRNMQIFNESRQLQKSPRGVLGDGAAAGALAAMERRNKQLASLLEETVTSLKSISMSSLDDKSKSLEVIELAAARAQFVQLYLGDSSMGTPGFDAAPMDECDAETNKDAGVDVSEEDGATNKAKTGPSQPGRGSEADGPGSDAADGADRPEAARHAAQDAAGGDDQERDRPSRARAPWRPAAPIPTRSTLAQSSFSWMLEPDEPGPSATPPSAGRLSAAQHQKRPPSNASRDRNAFLFGDGAADGDKKHSSKGDEIFGLEPLVKPRNKP